MKTLTTIVVDGDEQAAWEVYTDDSAAKTFGFIFSEEAAKVMEELLAAGKIKDEE